MRKIKKGLINKLKKQRKKNRALRDKFFKENQAKNDIDRLMKRYF